MKNITTLIFDMYGVIIEESKGNFIPYTYNHTEFHGLEYTGVKVDSFEELAQVMETM